MGPQRKQAMLDEACSSEAVKAAYEAVKAQAEASTGRRFVWNPELEKSQYALKLALQANGFNRFDARTLSNFAANTSNELSR